MIESKSFGSKAFKVINAIILILLAFSCFYPLWYTFCVSISSKAAAEGGLVTIYPIGSNVKSYSLIMGDSAFWNSFWISIKRVVIGTVWTMVVLIMMSYPLAKSKTEYKPRNVLMWILVFCMLFNGGTIPWFITVKNYGMIDTMAALVLAGSVPVFNVLLMMNFFRGIPGDLEEAARVDGAGPWRILWQIVVPCSKPVIATIVLFTSVGYWNEYFQGLVLMNKETNYPLQTYIRQISVQIPVGVTLTAEQYQQVSTELQQISGGSKGIHRPCSYADCISVPAEILCNRYYTGSSKRIMKYTKRGFLKRNRKPLFLCFSAMENGGGFRRFFLRPWGKQRKIKRY